MALKGCQIDLTHKLSMALTHIFPVCDLSQLIWGPWVTVLSSSIILNLWLLIKDERWVPWEHEDTLNICNVIFVWGNATLNSLTLLPAVRELVVDLEGMRQMKKVKNHRLKHSGRAVNNDINSDCCNDKIDKFSHILRCMCNITSKKSNNCRATMLASFARP